MDIFAWSKTRGHVYVVEGVVLVGSGGAVLDTASTFVGSDAFLVHHVVNGEFADEVSDQFQSLAQAMDAAIDRAKQWDGGDVRLWLC